MNVLVRLIKKLKGSTVKKKVVKTVKSKQIII